MINAVQRLARGAATHAMSVEAAPPSALGPVSDTHNLARFATDGGTTIERHEHLTDESLIGAVARRDHAGLAAVYSQHGNRVYALARGLCGEVRAEDLTQEIFLRLWNDPQRFSAERGSLRSCLLMEAHGRAVSFLRSDNTSGERDRTPNGPTEAEQSGAEAGALMLLEGTEVDELAAALPDDERRPIFLAYFGGHTYSEIARLLAVPEATIKSRIRTGLKRLHAESASRSPLI